jgi:ubiquinone/menaquinone biosynthesis C-methylase UbiE
MALEEARDYFEFLAQLGLTKHLGSMEATRQLVELCHIGRGQLVLDVGCGVGATPVFLARKLGCGVVGVDLLERMIEQSQDRARMERVTGQVELAVADARRLPFADGLFDAVIMESLNVFFEDKGKAMREYVRVTRPGGYVGIIEMTWLKPPLPVRAAYYRRMVHAGALEAGGWIALLEGTGLKDVVGNAQPVDIPRESMGRFERYGCRGITKAMLQALDVFLRDRASRAFMRDVTGSLPKGFLEDMGYGVYAGRKG